MMCVQRSSIEEREHIQVYLRIRPFTAAEKENGESQVKMNSNLKKKKKPSYSSCPNLVYLHKKMLKILALS